MTDYSFPIEGPIDLQVRVGHGSVFVETDDDLAAATVSVVAGKRPDDQDLLDQTAVRMDGNTLVVHGPRQGALFDLPRFDLRSFGVHGFDLRNLDLRGFDLKSLGRWANRGIEVHVRVPTGTPARISTLTAPITIGGTVGDADIAFGAADVGLRHVEGNLRMRFGNGSARAERVTGSVHLRAGSGSARFGEVGGPLEAGCGTGDLEVRVARGTIRSRCGAGSAVLREVHGDVDVASGAGGVEIGVPAGISARIDLHSGAGRVRSDFPVEGAAQSPEHAITLRARTGSGDVRLFRAA